MEINWKDFEKVDIRVGTVKEVKDFPEARIPAFQIKVDFGSKIGILKSSAQITKRYSKDELLGRQVLAVVNFPKKEKKSSVSGIRRTSKKNIRKKKQPKKKNLRQLLVSLILVLMTYNQFRNFFKMTRL